MKSLFKILFITNCFASLAQSDRLKFNMDLNLGNITYYFNEIENSGYYFSNVSWNDTVHSLDYQHKEYNVMGVTPTIHIGLNIPIINNYVFSVGVRPKVGFGRIIQYLPKALDVSNDYGYEEETDPHRISSFSTDVELNAYVKYNFEEKFRMESHITLLGGYRLVNAFDKYSTPMLCLEYGEKFWSIGFYSDLYRMTYYRKLSNGSVELAKSSHEIGFKVNLFLGKEKPRKDHTKKRKEKETVK